MWEVGTRKVLRFEPAEVPVSKGELHITGELPRDYKIIDVYGRKRSITKKYVPFDWHGKGTAKFS